MKAETRYLRIALGILLIGMILLGVPAINALPVQSAENEHWNQPYYNPWQSETELHKFIYDAGIWRNKYVPITYDCDDFAFALRDAADSAGKRIYILVKANEAGRYYHALNWAFVNGRKYEIEPQSRTGNLASMDWWD